MTIFLYGQDAYRLKQGLGQVISGYEKKYPGSLNLFSFDLSDKEQRSRFEDSLKTLSFFEEAKLMIARNSFVSKETSEWVKDVLVRHEINKAKSITVTVVEQVSQKDLEKTNKELFKDLASKSSTVRNFEYLEGAKLMNWVRSEFASLNCSIDTASARALIDLTGNESWQLANEIQKLANYRQKGTITSKDVGALVSGRTDLNIFDFVDAIVSKNRAKGYELLYRELKNGRDPYYLLSMIVFGFRNMLMVKDLLDRKTDPNLIAKNASLHPFVVRKTSASVSKYSQEDLKRSFGRLLEMDTSVKNGSLNLVDTLFEFVIV